MSYKYIQKIPSSQEIIKEIPLSKDLIAIKLKRDEEIKSIFQGNSQKFILIIGPCSADNVDSVCDYMGRLAKLQEKVKEKIMLIPRIYTNKPRTTGQGYKGMAHQPNPNEAPDIVEGIKAMRRMHVRVLKETFLTAADEMLYPDNYPYLEDILSYVAVGARSVENQQHRLAASGLDIPIGMKNPTAGDLNVMLNSVFAAQLSHMFVYNQYAVQTSGNDLAHCILRGAVNQYGRNIPNYHYEDLIRLANAYKERELKNPSIIVDANHANSSKDFRQQPRIVLEVIQSMKRSNLLQKMIKGVMIESYILEGNQSISSHEYGKSITDACLGWEDSEKLVLNIAEELSRG